MVYEFGRGRVTGGRGLRPVTELVPDLDESLRLRVTPGKPGLFQVVGASAPLLAPFDGPVRHHAAIGQRVKNRSRALAGGATCPGSCPTILQDGENRNSWPAARAFIGSPPASSSSPNSMESLPWTLRTRNPARVRLRVRSSRTGDTSKASAFFKGFLMLRR